MDVPVSTKGSESHDCRFCLDDVPDNPLANHKMPFEAKLSFLPLIEFWEQGLLDDRPDLAQALAAAPELREPIEDLSSLDAHRPLLEKLATAIFPPATYRQDLKAIVPGFEPEIILATPGFVDLMPNRDSIPRANVEPQLEWRLKLLHTYSLILDQLYDIQLDVNYPVVRSATDPDTGLMRHLLVDIDVQFIRVHAREDLPPLSDTQITQLRRNPSQLEAMLEWLPPEAFEFAGFMVIQAQDVTEQRLLSQINQQLIATHSIVCPETIDALQTKLRSLFHEPTLELGIAAMRNEHLMLLNPPSTAQKTCIISHSRHISLERYEGSAHEQCAQEQKVIIVEDLDAKTPRSELEEELHVDGIRNLAIAPLHEEDEVIGVLELKSRRLGALNPMNTMKVREVLPLFAAAVRRSLNDFQTRVDSLIKRQCTVIHPSVEWRFREAATDCLSRGTPNEFGQEPIAFKDVFPLFGASDIRNSSRLRNRSISEDLDRELNSVVSILQSLPTAGTVPITEQALNTCHEFLYLTQKEIRASDEYRITEFLQTEIRELFNLLRDAHPDLQPAIEAHLKRLDPQHDTLFESRRAYMDSVAQLNSAFGDILDTAQDEAQKIYPHYFEKHSTDGVDFTLYIGQSLCREQTFHPLYLDNLRLWQLILMCDLACTNQRLKSELPIPLETTHLVAVQDHPVSIRFRFDERLFDVDGAYNARYEIMKKRIDKATIKGRSERLTQPDKIAIVYSNTKEASKYHKHIAYLERAGYLIPGFEDLQVEDLQGVEGLKAMRVTVNLDREPQQKPNPESTVQANEPVVTW